MRDGGTNIKGVTRSGHTWRWVLLSLAVCGVLLLGRGEAVAAGPFVKSLSKFESRSYEIHTNLTRVEALEFGQHMDLIFREYSDRFAILRGADRGKQNLYLLRTREDYIRAMAEFGNDASASGGMFFWGDNGTGLSTWVEGMSRDQVYNTLQHEGFHQFANAKLGDELPLWVNEGLAEYFGSAIIVDGRVRLGIVDEDRVNKIRQALEQSRAIPFDDLLNIESAQWHANMRSGSAAGALQYDQSWAIVHFLVHGDKGRYQKAFENYLVLLSRGRNHREAFQQSFGSDDTSPFAKRWVMFMETVEADPYSTMLKRLQFLGHAALFLKEHGETPADLAAMKDALKKRGFRMTRQTEAGSTTIDSADDLLYFYTDAKGAEVPFELIAPADPLLPPSITARHAKPGVTLTWRREGGDQLWPVLDYN